MQSCKFFSLVSSFIKGIFAAGIVCSMPKFHNSLCAALWRAGRVPPHSGRHAGFFTLHLPLRENECRLEKFGDMKIMPLSGEAIRMMNYVDDVSTTLRRILALVPILTTEERHRVSEYLAHANPGVETVIKALNAV